MENLLGKLRPLLKSKYILLIILLVLMIFYVLVISLVKLFSKSATLVETNTDQVEITQAYVSVSVTGWDSNGDSKTDTAVLQYSPLVNISTFKEIEKFEIRNVKLTNEINDGNHFVTWPKHFEQNKSSNTFYEDMGVDMEYSNRPNEGDSFSYSVVDQVGFVDEIGTYGGYVDLRYTIYGLGESIDYEGILDRDGVYSGGKELQYAGLQMGDINSPIEFDVVVTFADKSKAIKHFSLTSNFEEIYNQGFSFVYNSEEYVGKKF